MEIIRQFGRLIGIKNKQYESLTEINFEGYKIRIWRTAGTLKKAQDFDHTKLKADMEAIVSTTAGEHWTAELMKLPKVACVAIVDASGCGVSAYPNWG